MTVTQIIEKFGCETWDETRLLELMQMQQELSAHCYSMARKVHENSVNYHVVNQQRKVAHAKAKVKHLQTKNGTESEELAVSETEEIRLIEGKQEGHYRGTKEILSSVHKVLDAMSQHISFYKRLYEQQK